MTYVHGSSNWTNKNFYSLPESGGRESYEVQWQENPAYFKIPLRLRDQVLRNTNVLELMITNLIWLCTSCGPVQNKKSVMQMP